MALAASVVNQQPDEIPGREVRPTTIASMAQQSSTVLNSSQGVHGRNDEESQSEEERQGEHKMYRLLRIVREARHFGEQGEVSDTKKAEQAETVKRATNGLGVGSIEAQGRREISETPGGVELMLECVCAMDTQELVRKDCCLVLANVTLERTGRLQVKKNCVLLHFSVHAPTRMKCQAMQCSADSL